MWSYCYLFRNYLQRTTAEHVSLSSETKTWVMPSVVLLINKDWSLLLYSAGLNGSSCLCKDRLNKTVHWYTTRWNVLIKSQLCGLGSNLWRSARHRLGADALTDWTMNDESEVVESTSQKCYIQILLECFFWTSLVADIESENIKVRWYNCGLSLLYSK